MRILGAWVWCALVAGATGATACGDDAASAPDGGATSTGAGAGTHATGVTFHKDVEPILQARCLGCHRIGEIGGFSLEKYASASAMSEAIVAMTESGYMPPFLAKNTDECPDAWPWVDDWRLSAEELATLRAWHENGAPEGNPADAPPVYVPGVDGLPGATAQITPASPTLLPAQVSDQFICVVYDPAVAADTFLDGVFLVADNTLVTHHAIISRADRADVAALSGGQERFPCFGGFPGDVVHAWVPGARPLELPAGVGIPVGPSDVFVVQMHYHPANDAQEDSSTLQLRTMSATPEYTYQVGLIGPPAGVTALLPGPNDEAGVEFRIPAGVKGHTEHAVYGVPDLGTPEAKILTIANHMHYVGVNQRSWISRNGEADTCMLHTPRWDFNWQRFYQIDLPLEDLPVTRPGDLWHVECEYDNSMENPFVAKALAEQGLSAPVDILLGEETLDEMCIVGVGYLLPYAP